MVVTIFRSATEFLGSSALGPLMSDTGFLGSSTDI